MSNTIGTTPIRAATSAYEFFRKEVSQFLKSEHVGDVGGLTRAVSARWQSLPGDERKEYEDLASEDKARFRSESYERDTEVLKLQEQRRLKREDILIDTTEGFGRTTRSGSKIAKAIEEEEEEDEEDEEEEDDEEEEEEEEKNSDHSSASSSDVGGDHFGRGGGSDSSDYDEGPAAPLRKGRQGRRRSATASWDSDDESESSFDEEEEVPAPKKRKQAPAAKKKTNTRKKVDKWDSDESEESESSISLPSDSEEEDKSEEDENDFDSDDSAAAAPKSKKKKPVKKKAAAKAKAATQKQKPAAKVVNNKPLSERQELEKWEKDDKEKYIAKRQGELKEERADQAKRRLEFLLKQSDVFAHFGGVKEDKANFHSGSATTRSSTARAAIMEDDNTNPGAATTKGNDPDDPDYEEKEIVYLTTQPESLTGTMRSYQLEGLNWMIRLQENGVNGILADEMGLGKTLQAISILVYLKEYRNCDGPHLVIVPKSTLSNWMNEFSSWAPNITPIRFHGNKEEREEMLKHIIIPAQRDDQRQWNVCVTTYEICNVHKNVLNKFAWSYLIIDEAHRLKNEASAFSQTVRTFETRYRLLLTGTPLQNNLHELWALLNFLVPDVFASAEQFDDWFNLDIDDAEEKNRMISQLHKILRPFMLRRLKADVEKSLPPKHETILYTGMSVMQKKLYKNILLRDITALQDGNQSALLNIVMQLRKCAGHPYLFPGVEDRKLPPLGEHLVQNCGKMVLLDKLLVRLHEGGHRVLLFTQMTRILDILEDYMVMRRYKYCRIDGNRTYEEREDSIDAFNAPQSEIFAFLLSTRAGGLGINLQTADVVILYDSDWNPQADLQAQDRAHRIGQTREVQVFRLVTQDTIEEKVVERAQQKLKLDAMVVQQGRLKDKDAKLSRDDLLSAVRFGADKVFKSMDTDITDDDIDMILNIGKKKTQELNDKFQTADKGDMLDFKLDGGSMSAQTFEGVDYSQLGKDFAQAKADQAQADLLSILELGKRESRSTVANYNEEHMYRQQMGAGTAGANTSESKDRKKKVGLPKHLRLPRMEEWQMFDREALLNIQQKEEDNFINLPTEIQKNFVPTVEGEVQQPFEEAGDDSAINKNHQDGQTSLPPLLTEEQQEEKKRLWTQGFIEWNRNHYNTFIKASAKFGRRNYPKIAEEVGKPTADIKEYALVFSSTTGKTRITEHEYERVIKTIEKGEKKIFDLSSLQRGTSIFISLFQNPWLELEFSHVNCKDKMFTQEEDRYLLCWAHKYGYKNWTAVKFAIRRSHTFRMDYFLKALPVDAIGRRCEQLMKAAEREVEQLEKEAREDEEEAARVSSSTTLGDSATGLTPVKLPTYKEMMERKSRKKQEEIKNEEVSLENNVQEIEFQITVIQDRLKMLEKNNSDNHYKNHNSRTSTSESDLFPEKLLPELANFVAQGGSTGSMSLASQFVDMHPEESFSNRQVGVKIDEIASKEKRDKDGELSWYIKPAFFDLVHVDEGTPSFQVSAARATAVGYKVKQKKRKNRPSSLDNTSSAAAIGPDGDMVPFPFYDPAEPPKECKKAFTLFCNATRKEVKSTLNLTKRKDKNVVNSILKERWFSLTSAEKQVWKLWQEWDKKRYANDLQMNVTAQAQEQQQDDASKLSSSLNNPNIPKKIRSIEDSDSTTKLNASATSWHSTSCIPKKKRSTQSFL